MKEITTKEEFEAIIQGTGVVVVDFFMDGCPPCRQLAPKLEEWSQTYPNITIIKVNGKKYGASISGYNCRSFPTVVFYENGNKKETITGFVPQIEEKIKEYNEKIKPPVEAPPENQPQVPPTTLPTPKTTLPTSPPETTIAPTTIAPPTLPPVEVPPKTVPPTIAPPETTTVPPTTVPAKSPPKTVPPKTAKTAASKNLR